MEKQWLNPSSDILTKAIKNPAVRIDEAQGIVECFVAAIGNKDSVGDIIIPGAFSKSLGRRKPRVVWGHNWNEPVGKVLEMYEVSSNDERLPDKMKSQGVGGLYAKVQFNLASERGREAFATIAFFGEEQEWSIGYKTIDKEYDSMRQANILKEVELYEVSPVLHGANQLTGTITVKSADIEGASCPIDALSNALSSGLEEPVVVQYIEGNTLVYQDSKQNHWATPFEVQENGFVFGRPHRVILRAVIEPLEDEEYDPNCQCGRHLPPPGHPLYSEPGKTAESDVETKAIRILGGSVVEKLQQAIALIQEAIAPPAATPVPSEGAPVERKFGAKEYSDYAERAPGRRFVLGRPALLSGTMVKVVPSTTENVLDQAAKIVEALSGMIGTIALSVPSVKGLNEGLTHIAVYLPKTNSPELFTSYIIEAVKGVSDASTEIEHLDGFDKSGKPFEEVFLK